MKSHTIIIRLFAAAMASAMLLALAACAGDGGNDADSTGPVSSPSHTAGGDAMTPDGSDGCEGAPVGADCTAETGYPASTIVRRFAACLVSKGFDARIVGERNDQVALLEIDAAGNPKQPRLIPGDDGVITQDWTTDPALYPNIMSTGILSNGITGDDFPYIIARDSADPAGSPYAAKQQDYAACERADPDFTQGVQRLTADDENASQTDRNAVLAFARAARARGFDWVADPSGDHPLSIVIPADVPEHDVRRFLRECDPGDAPVTYSWHGDYPYDIHSVQQELSRIG
ncbi:hypothetical protein COO72_00870 [Bifidobacterium callitrichos]|nr:hypothetical protein COO72_00870 [Bifidobacterium callitrichos]